MKLMKIADVPPTMVSPAATVREAVHAMVQNRVGAVAVVEQDVLMGIFTERDVMIRVVLAKLDPDQTTVAEVMTTAIVTITPETKPGDALSLMVDRHIRHLPITNGNHRILGMVSIRNLLQRRVEDLSHELEGLETYLTADGIGG